MNVTGDTIDLLFKGFNTKYNEFHKAMRPSWDRVAMKMNSTGSEEVYGWLEDLPQIREWLGSRVITQFQTADYVIKNRKFEQTIRVAREDIEDDKIGLYDGRLRMMAHSAAMHPDELVFGLLNQGFTEPCYDGQNFFDVDHPYHDENDQVQSVANMQDGSGPAWFLLDTSRPIKPMVFQERIPYEPQSLDKDSDSHVFLSDEYLYGMRARVNVGFGLWQLAFGSKADLTEANYAAARASMQSRRYNQGRIMGLTPTLLVVPPVLEAAARELLISTRVDGSDNVWAASAELLVSPFLAA